MEYISILALTLKHEANEYMVYQTVPFVIMIQGRLPDPEVWNGWSVLRSQLGKV